MEIQALKLFVTEDEINDLLEKFLPPDLPIQELSVRLTPEGVVVQGVYPSLLVKMAFETLWEITAAGTELNARLANVKVAGLPAGKLRGLLIKMIRDAIASEPGLSVQDNALRVDVEEALRAKSLPLQVSFTGVRCSLNSLVLEAGPVG
jgi:hypothetical protein